MATNIQLFHSPKFQPLKCPLFERPCLCDVIPSDSKLASFTRSAKYVFSKRLSTSPSSMLSFRTSKHVWLKIVWLNSSFNLKWKPSRQNLSEGMTSRKRGLAAECRKKWRQRCSNFGLLCRLKRRA